MNLPQVVSVQNMRQSDARVIEEQTTSAELMHRAAMGIFEAVQFVGRVAIVCGAGNNGGDGYALACILREHGITPTIFRVTDKFSKDGMFYYRTAKSLGCEEGPLSVPSPFTGFDIVVDCILGTGFKGEVQGEIRHAIEEINACTAFVISADINSGVNGDTGIAEIAVKSDLTVSIGAYKTGMFLGDAPRFIGRLRNVDIGIQIIEDEYKLIDFEHLHMFEGYGSVVMSMDEFCERTGCSENADSVAERVREMTEASRQTIVVKTDRAAVIGDIKYVYFCADYVD